MPLYPHIRELFFALLKQIVGLSTEIIQGGSKLTGTDVARFTHKSDPVIFEPPCTLLWYSDAVGPTSNGCCIGRLLSIEIMAVVGLFALTLIVNLTSHRETEETEL